MKSLFTTIATLFVTLMGKVFALVDGKEAQEVSADDICALLANPSESNFILVDVRSEAEISVSIIPDAITRDELESSLDDYRNRVVIPYCTIGGRSLIYARQLSRQGIDSRNFKAGIIGWCEAGLPLATPQGDETNRVHTHTTLFRVPPTYEQVTQAEKTG